MGIVPVLYRYCIGGCFIADTSFGPNKAKKEFKHSAVFPDGACSFLLWSDSSWISDLSDLKQLFTLMS